MDPMDKIYQKYAQYVYKYLMSITHNSDLSEELTQETFYQAVKSANRYDGSCQVTTWLCAIAKNRYMAYLKKNPAQESLEAMDEEYGYTAAKECESPETQTVSKESRLRVLKMLHSMDEPYREVIYLRLMEDLSFSDIGEVMGKSENWARVTFFRGKEKLKKEIENNEEI